MSKIIIQKLNRKFIGITISLFYFIIGNFLFFTHSFAEDNFAFPLESRSHALRESAIGLGTFNETPIHRTGRKYDRLSAGTSINLSQKLNPYFRGTLQVKWSEWILKKNIGNSSQEYRVSPVNIFSKIEYIPTYLKNINSVFGNYIQPFIMYGHGYVLFFQQHNLNFKKSHLEGGEFSGTYGYGVRIIWPEKLAIRIAYERWVGWKTADYDASLISWELEFGNLIQ